MVFSEGELKDPLAFDRTLREIFQALPGRFAELLLGERVKENLPTTLPSVKDRTVDFLGRLSSGKLIQIEIQSVHDPEICLRLVDTYIRIYEKYKEYPLQIILWIGDGKCPYGKRIKVGELNLKVLSKDIKKISCETLLESDDPLDSVMAVLCKEVDNFWDRLREKVLKRPEEERGDCLVKLFHLAKAKKKINN